MTAARLSPAMRNMLRAAIAGKPVASGDTRDALIKRGMLDVGNQPTAAGRAVFAPLNVSEDRRPGVSALATRLKREHPDWSDMQAATQAKHLYTNRGVTC